MLRRLAKAIAWLTGTLLIFLLTIYCVRIYDALNMMPLRVEHRITLDTEFHAGMENVTTWQDYLELEPRIAEELNRKLASRGNNFFLERHAPNGPLNPENLGRNWNYSYVLQPDNPAGAAVLLHGLSDSPYSMRSTAELFRDYGLASYVPRMPGHGFAVGSLRQAEWEDWLAVVRITIREAHAQRRSGQPLILAGYSNGALLAVRYVLDCLQEDELICPDGILLISPAIAVTPFARFGDWHELVSWIDDFEALQWQSILPEIDPYKFTSFPKNPGRQVFELSTDVDKDLMELINSDRAFPKLILFQSQVDDTVNTRAALEFVEKIPGMGHELVVYDVNQNEDIVELMISEPDDLIDIMETEAPFAFHISLLTNESAGSQKMRLVELIASSTELVSTAMDLEWPEEVYSLSHIALPFAPDDPVYGDGINNRYSTLGTLTPRGERNVMNLSPEYFLRLRSNPFYSFQEHKISAWLEQLLGQ